MSRFGVLITFNRPDDLQASLVALAAQTEPLDHLYVVDNAPTRAAAELVAAHGATYVPQPSNMGPAGGISAGLRETLEVASDTDWVVLLDDDDPPPRSTTLADMHRISSHLSSANIRVGAVGLWGASLNGRTGRLNANTANTPRQVDYVSGDSCPHYRVAALRMAGPVDPELFFGFDDLALCLQVADAGWSIWSSGLARAHNKADRVENRTVSAAVAEPTWRRYYSLRNLVVLLRKHDRTMGALTMSLAAGVAKPVANLVKSPQLALANLKLNLLALKHGWTGQLGKTFDPAQPSGFVLRDHSRTRSPLLSRISRPTKSSSSTSSTDAR